MYIISIKKKGEKLRQIHRSIFWKHCNLMDNLGGNVFMGIGGSFKSNDCLLEYLRLLSNRVNLNSRHNI